MTTAQPAVPGDGRSFTSFRALGGADLHVHTTHSDGACSPCEVVVAASRVGLRALAITDHDTVSALPIARVEAMRWGVELIAGVELTCVQEADETVAQGPLKEPELHMLGYFIRDDDPDLLSQMKRLREGRKARIEVMAERLRELGFSIDLAVLRSAFPRAVLGRAHLAEYLTRTGQVGGRREVFTRYLGDNGPACCPKPRLEASAAIKLIVDAGGVAALAHPPFFLRRAVVERLVAAGMRAIEVDGPGFSNRMSRRIAFWAGEFNLVAVCGSDFHAPNGPGRWVGSIMTSAEQLERLRSCAKPLVHPLEPALPPSVKLTDAVE
jgi:predicted metal-dependent phosphoesterase TrpH